MLSVLLHMLAVAPRRDRKGPDPAGPSDEALSLERKASSAAQPAPGSTSAKPPAQHLQRSPAARVNEAQPDEWRSVSTILSKLAAYLP